MSTNDIRKGFPFLVRSETYFANRSFLPSRGGVEAAKATAALDDMMDTKPISDGLDWLQGLVVGIDAAATSDEERVHSFALAQCPWGLPCFIYNLSESFQTSSVWIHPTEKR